MGWEGRLFWQMNMSSDAGQLLPKPWNNDDDYSPRRKRRRLCSFRLHW